MTRMDTPLRGSDATATVTEVATEVARTRTITDLVDDVGWLNSRVHLNVQDATQLQSETTQLHTDALQELIRTRANALSAKPLKELLLSLGEGGFAWRDIARLVGVSVPALRKWRQGESATPENRLKVARLLALCDMLEEKAAIADPASWLEMPLVEDVPVCGLDLLLANRSDLLFRRALHHGADPEALLEEFDPDWRSTYRGPFELFEADDGLPGLRPRDADG
jgi:hypothetical protein